MNIKKSLLFKMLTMIVLLLILPISISGFYLYSQITNDLTNMAKERVTVSNQASESLINKYGDSLLGANKTNSRWADFRTAIENKDLAWIDDNVNPSVDIIPNLHFVATTTLDGKIISQVGDIKEFSGSSMHSDILEQLKSKTEFSGLIQTSEGLAIIAVSKVTNEENDKEPTGILIFGRILDNEALKEIKDTLHDDVAILTNSGTMLTTSKDINKNDLTSYLNHKNNDLQLFETNHSNSVETAQMITSLKDFTDEPIGILYVSQKQNTSTLVKHNLNNVNLVIGSIFVIILLLLSLLIYKLIIKPIQQLVIISENVAKGDLISEVDEKISKREDEFGRLSRSLNKMIEQFASIIGEVNKTSVDLAKSSHLLYEGSKLTSQNNKKITNDIQMIAQDSEKQLFETKESAAAMDEISSQVLQVAKNSEVMKTSTINTANSVQEMAKTIEKVSMASQNATKFASDVQEDAVDGKKHVENSKEEMVAISAIIQEAATVMDHLGKSSEEIGSIVEVIDSIAEQTNLLALNAAIEAARAGEHGKGFSVVADEVKNLAERSAGATKEIAGLIKGIQEETKKAVHAISIGNKRVVKGNQLAESASTAIQKMVERIERIANELSQISYSTSEQAKESASIVKDIETLEEQVNQVAKATQEQTLGVNEITKAIAKIAEISQKTTANLQEVAEESKQGSDRIKEIFSDAPEEHNKLSMKLQETIKKFKLKEE